jgi:hypothetical protein
LAGGIATAAMLTSEGHAMSALTAPGYTPAAAAESAHRNRLLVIAALLAATSIAAAVGGLLWPAPAADWYSYADVAPVRETFWLVLTLVGAAVALGVPLQAAASMSLVRRRGATWVTIGAFTAWIGSALLAVTLGGWATTYYVTTGPGLDPGAAAALLDRFAHDGHLFAIGEPGSLLVSIGTILAGVGLIRSRVLPLWIPVLSMLTVAGTFLPSWGPVSLVTNIPAAVVAIAIGWSAYRRAAAPAVTDPGRPAR